MSPELKRTALYKIHTSNGAKMVPFAGFEMPVQYEAGVLAEHNHTREGVSLFDVSHMGQAFVMAKDGLFETSAKAMEALVPADVQSLKPGQQRYTQLLDENGGILDDLMIARLSMEGYESVLYLVVNASRKEADYAHISEHLPEGVGLSPRDDILSLLALQGPGAANALTAFTQDLQDMPFMTGKSLPLFGGFWAQVTRCGYTGEDGYEISLKTEDVPQFTRMLLDVPGVELAGLGARDSLRLEAGLCLYGHDIDTSVSPVEAGLLWSIPKHRRGADAGYLGAARVAADIANKGGKRLVGIVPDGKAPAREGTEIQDSEGNTIGTITSGGFGPSVGGPVAMGYVNRPHNKTGTAVQLIVRGKARPARTVKMPFVAHNYFRGS